MPCWLWRYLASWSVGREGLKPAHEAGVRVAPGAELRDPRAVHVPHLRLGPARRDVRSHHVVVRRAPVAPCTGESAAEVHVAHEALEVQVLRGVGGLGIRREKVDGLLRFGIAVAEDAVVGKDDRRCLRGQLQGQQGLEMPGPTHGERIHVFSDELAGVLRELPQVAPLGVSQDGVAVLALLLEQLLHRGRELAIVRCRRRGGGAQEQQERPPALHRCTSRGVPERFRDVTASPTMASSTAMPPAIR